MMLITRKLLGIFCLAAGGGLVASPVLAQSALEKPAGQAIAQPSTTAPGTATRTATQKASTTGNLTGQNTANLNNEIAVWLVLGNQEEVALGQFAEQRSQNPEVKRFAQQMIEHHRQALAKIEQAAPETAEWHLQLRAENSGRSAATSRQSSGVQQASAEVEVSANSAGHHRSVQLAQKIKQECLNLTEQELSQQQGAEFDKAYIGQQVAAHVGMLAQLRGSKSFATGDLQQVIAEGEQTTQNHLAEAKKIMTQLKNQHASPSSQTSQRPATATPSR